MKKTFLNLKSALVLGTMAAFLFACQSEGILSETQSEELVPVTEPRANGANDQVIANNYIIVLKEGTLRGAAVSKSDYKSADGRLRSEINRLFNSLGIAPGKIKATYGFATEGFAAELTDEQLSLLQRDSRVASIEKDIQIQLNPPLEINMGKPGGGGGGSTPSQSTPWGIARVGGAGDGTGKTAWIIDSGIQQDHPDLNVDTQRSISFLGGRNTSPDDQNGHGTHVAGTVAALNNTIGVVGVAAGASVVAVRVLDRRGSGSISGVIAGVDYVAANGNNGDVANMSLGGGVSTTLDNAVINAAATGVKFALAAGNESDDAINHSPARAEGANIFTISAFDSSDRFASFSNFGAGVDFACPGVSINSTWTGSGYNTISGTSMAAPHMAGLLLLGNVTTDGFVINDPDGNPDPIAHR
ncbi:MAG: S8 family serine peptidase [Bacteroidetes bacterium]|nr:S8 family serine peptidase [Bacteroidota bacterium]